MTCSLTLGVPTVPVMQGGFGCMGCLSLAAQTLDIHPSEDTLHHGHPVSDALHPSYQMLTLSVPWATLGTILQ